MCDAPVRGPTALGVRGPLGAVTSASSTRCRRRRSAPVRSAPLRADPGDECAHVGHGTDGKFAASVPAQPHRVAGFRCRRNPVRRRSPVQDQDIQHACRTDRVEQGVGVEEPPEPVETRVKAKFSAVKDAAEAAKNTTPSGQSADTEKE